MALAAASSNIRLQDAPPAKRAASMHDGQPW